jgi:hypothetical protein
MNDVVCPLPEMLLHDYFAGDLERDRADQLEEHVFECSRCAAAFERAGELAAQLRTLVPPVISQASYERLAAGHTPIRLTRLAPGERAAIEFSDDVTLLVHALRADLAGASGVHVDILGPGGEPLLEVPHAPFDSERGEVLIACQRHYVDLYPREITFRVWSVVGGRRRRAGEYGVDHLLPGEHRD